MSKCEDPFDATSEITLFIASFGLSAPYNKGLHKKTTIGRFFVYAFLFHIQESNELVNNISVKTRCCGRVREIFRQASPALTQSHKAVDMFLEPSCYEVWVVKCANNSCPI